MINTKYLNQAPKIGPFYVQEFIFFVVLISSSILTFFMLEWLVGASYFLLVAFLGASLLMILFLKIRFRKFNTSPWYIEKLLLLRLFQKNKTKKGLSHIFKRKVEYV